MKILVVEDNTRIAQSIKHGLEQEKYTVDLAFDGQTGLELAGSNEYDVVVFDVMLPKLSGIAALKQLRAEGIQTPVLVLTAKDQLADKVGGLDAGADDYLVKPFAFEELVARLRALTRRPTQNTATVVQVADLELDTTSYTITRAGVAVHLTKKEFALLEYLMRHQGQTISKDQIISRVWSYDADITDSTVEAFIKSLRKKIDLPFDGPKLLHTHRGFGYKLGYR